MPRVALHTLGCKLNFAETGTLGQGFRDRGYRIVGIGQAADVAVINTCSVTDEAERKCRQAIRRVLRAHPDTFVVVTGCYAQLRPNEIAGIEGVDLVLGTHEKLDLFRHLDLAARKERTQIEVSCIDKVALFGPAHAAGERTRAFLKVQDGCDYGCSFCTIPKARGRSRSHSIAGAVDQARAVAADGYREIVLSGVNIGLFGQDTGETLLDLLRALDGVDGIERYRISSIEPNLLTDRILEFVAESRAFQPHFHVPLQSGDDYVLGRMRRRYRREAYADRIRAIRRCMPDAGIGADVIVGFPSETDERFANTVSFVDDLDVSYLHVFTYSERPDTHVVDHPDWTGGASVARRERSRRSRVLRSVSDRKRQAFARRHLHTARPVLWEEPEPGGDIEGFTDNYIRVRGQASDHAPGTIETVHLAVSEPEGLIRTGPLSLPVLG